MILKPPIFSESGTLAGVQLDIDIAGFVARKVEVQNLDSANTYTLVIAGATISLPPQRKVSITCPLAGISTLSLNGTGDFQVLAAGDGVEIAMSALDGLTPENAGAIQSVVLPFGDLAAGVNLSSTFAWLNDSPDKTVQIQAVTLIPKSTVTTLGGGETCEVEVAKTGGNPVVTGIVFDDNPGAPPPAIAWPAYSGPGEVTPFTLTAVAADLLLAPGEALFVNVTQTAAAAVGDFALEVSYRVLV